MVTNMQLLSAKMTLANAANVSLNTHYNTAGSDIRDFHFLSHGHRSHYAAAKSEDDICFPTGTCLQIKYNSQTETRTARRRTVIGC